MDAKTKKILLVFIGVVVLIWVILSNVTDTDPIVGSKSMVYIPKEISKEDVKIKKVKFFIDFSGSMRGFADFAGYDLHPSERLSSILSKAMDNLSSTYNITPVAQCNKNEYEKDKFIEKIKDEGIFSESTTDLNTLIKSGYEYCTDSTVSVIVSDMVLSHGRKTLLQKGDTFYNQHEIVNLCSKIYGIASDLKTKKGCDMIILQYLSNYNSKYYCNYTENLKPNKFKDTIMNDRPYYVMLLGKKNNLIDIIDSSCFKNFENIYTSFSFNLDKNNKTTDYKVAKEESAKLWELPEEAAAENTDKEGTYTLTLNVDTGSDMSEFKFSFSRKKFHFPKFLGSEEDMYAACENKNVHNVELIQPLAKDSIIIVKVTMKEYADLQSDNITVDIKAKSSSWTDSCSMDDDIIQPTDLEKKTWGLSHIIGEINDAYKKKSIDVKVATFDFKIQVNK